MRSASSSTRSFRRAARRPDAHPDFIDGGYSGDVLLGRRPRVRTLLAVGFLGLLAPVLYSYVSTMILPSSLPLGVRSVEWLRTHDANWLVDGAEHVYYGWRTPAKGGPQLGTLPAVGLVHTPKRLADPAHASYRPAAIRSVFPSPLPGEGVWHTAGPPVNGGAPVLVTTFRTERDYPRIVAYVAWFDHTRTALAYYPGRYEPPAAVLRGPTEVPHGQRWRLLATFNSGFIYIDGNNGDSVNGVTNEPLKDGNATLVAYRNGAVNIVRWAGGSTAPRNVAFTRQSLPPIIWNGKLNPALNDSTQWGFTLGNAVRVWRTGIGIDRHGNLIYAAADFQTVRTLAEILLRAGAVRAMQLDINPEWPTLITYRHRHGLVPTRIVPNYQQPVTRYLVPDDRDFFAVYRRLPGRVNVPLK